MLIYAFIYLCMNGSCLTHCMLGQSITWRSWCFPSTLWSWGWTSGGQARQRLFPQVSLQAHLARTGHRSLPLNPGPWEFSLIFNTGWLPACSPLISDSNKQLMAFLKCLTAWNNIFFQLGRNKSCSSPVAFMASNILTSASVSSFAQDQAHL